MKYIQAVLGGTFDRLHAGHKRLIDSAFENAEKITIGITTNQLIKNKMLSQIIEDYATREKTLKEYLQSKNYLQRSEIIQINDIYGTTLEKNNAQALFVTKSTYPNARIINQERKKRSLPPLKIHIVPFVHGSDGKIITSERIRYGEIDREGNSYMQIFADKKTLSLPQQLRHVLKEPLGEVEPELTKVTKDLNKYPFVIAVGDIIVESLTAAGHQPDIGIIDYRTRRHPLSQPRGANLPAGRQGLFHLRGGNKGVENHPGTINKKAVEHYCQALKKFIETKEKQTIIINGEEDLLALPAILLAPLQSVVLYGQYDRGIVVNYVTEKIKQKVSALLEQFD